MKKLFIRIAHFILEYSAIPVFLLGVGLFLFLGQMEWFKYFYQLCERYPILLIIVSFSWIFGFGVMINKISNKIPKFFLYLLFIVWILIGAVCVVMMMGQVPTEWELMI